MKWKNLSYLFALLSPFVFFFNAQAKTIWQIGIQNYSFSREFIFTDEDVIDYEVPPNWKEIQGQKVQFPAGLYAYYDGEKNPRQIRINFCYTEEYNNPSLFIWATPEFVDLKNPHYLWLFKGKEIFIEKKLIGDNSFYPYSFSLGYIKKGLLEENRISIISTGPSNIPIIFDTVYLYLDDKDSDGDGIIDIDEGDCYLDQDTICIPIRSYDPSDIKRISLYIEKPEETSPSLHDVRFLDQNALSFPNWLRSGYLFPFGLLGFRVEEIAPQDKIGIQIGYMDILYPSACFYAYQGSNEWQEVDFEFQDGNRVKIFLNDGGAGDFDRERDGNINTILGLSYTLGLDAHIEKGSCFIKTFSQ